MERRTFGRAGLGDAGAGSAAPVYHSAPEPEMRRALGQDAVYQDGDTQSNGVSYVVGFMSLPLLLALIEVMFSGTAIITPINSSVLWTMRIAGLIYGAVFWWFVTQSRTYVKTNLFKAILMWLSAPLFMAVAFDGIAWRVADIWEFGISTAPFETATYKIEGISHGRKGARDTIQIDPFNTSESLDIAIPDEQYDALSDTTGDQCVTVHQRKSASGVIQVLSDGRYTMKSSEPLDIQPC